MSEIYALRASVATYLVHIYAMYVAKDKNTHGREVNGHTGKNAATLWYVQLKAR